MEPSPSVDRTDQLAFGFIASKVLLSAIELGLFTVLAKGPLSAEQIRIALGLLPRVEQFTGVESMVVGIK